MAAHDDLDELLDSALADFRNVDGAHRAQKSFDKLSVSEQNGTTEEAAQIKSGQPTVGQGLGLGLPVLSPGRTKSGIAKGKSSANSLDAASRPDSVAGTSARESSTSTDDGHLSETLEKLAEQTRRTLEGLDTATDEDALGDTLVEDLVKQFEEFGGSQDMQSIMDRMMHQLLSKEVLHEPMKEIGERYPQWLEANKSKLSKDDYLRYSSQYALIKQLCQVYETNPDDFPKIVDLMQRMQECGQPPNDIVQDLAPGLELGQDGLPMLSELLPEGEQGLGQNCSIM